ncbi:MAG: ribonuclease HIII [Thomasclavelia sp.]|nr:ribonuclease HIII [Thomasclavelia sp.]
MKVNTLQFNNLIKHSPVEAVSSDVDYSNYYKKSHIGCDETGSGDFFGPLCVVACYIDARDIDWLISLGLHNPTEMDSNEVIKIAQEIKDRVIYSLLMLDNSHYNNFANEGNNLATIKAKLYNQAITNVMQKLAMNNTLKIANQFVSPKTYFNYLKNEVIVVKDLKFTKEGYDKYAAIMCASILSRYAYYQYFNNMSKALKIKIPRGTTSTAEGVAVEIANKYGFKMLHKVTKNNLTSFKRVKEALKK